MSKTAYLPTCHPSYHWQVGRLWQPQAGALPHAGSLCVPWLWHRRRTPGAARYGAGKRRRTDAGNMSLGHGLVPKTVGLSLPLHLFLPHWQAADRLVWLGELCSVLLQLLAWAYIRFSFHFFSSRAATIPAELACSHDAVSVEKLIEAHTHSNKCMHDECMHRPSSRGIG